MGFIPPHMLKAKAASQNVSAEEREASRRTMEIDAARQAQRQGGEKGKASGGGSSTEGKDEQKKGGDEEKKQIHSRVPVPTNRSRPRFSHLTNPTRISRCENKSGGPLHRGSSRSRRGSLPASEFPRTEESHGRTGVLRRIALHIHPAKFTRGGSRPPAWLYGALLSSAQLPWSAPVRVDQKVVRLWHEPEHQTTIGRLALCPTIGTGPRIFASQ
ncbi:hypothetical protein CABS03_11361 [Colletotrichum abscissum]|uniref:Uncharacterized protein n=1 Tax=Colletotrichum abscissum TaxID=1671311 RepID=A0A9Q0B6H2_9PEZI|nr:hypothetical protein CABS02_00940 [Colletotrichum abscissum]